MKWIFQRFFSPLNLSRACRRSVRHTPFLVCGMLRFGCATCSDFTVRHAPIYAQNTRMNLNLSSEIAKSCSSPSAGSPCDDGGVKAPTLPPPNTTSLSLYADSEFALSDLGEVSCMIVTSEVELIF